jgi:Arc/MetJ family transcription regulator
MRTTVTIPDGVLVDLMRFSEASTRTEAVNRAVSDWVRLKRKERIKALRGALSVEGDVGSLRELEVGELEDLET